MPSWPTKHRANKKHSQNNKRVKTKDALKRGHQPNDEAEKEKKKERVGVALTQQRKYKDEK